MRIYKAHNSYYGGNIMDKLTELKEHVAKLFAAATDKETIEKAAVVNQKIDEAIEEANKKNSDYQALLKDYKDVVLHSSFKPNNTDNPSPAGDFDPNAMFKRIFIDSQNNK
jgi:hypothetical protein